MPWISLAILLLTYSVFGWNLAASKLPWQFIWLIASGYIFLLTSLLLTPLKNFKVLVIQWFKTKIGGFICIASLAFLLVVVFTWIEIFSTILILISAEALARMDIQISGIKQWPAFALLATVCLMGVGLGCGIYLLSGGHPFVSLKF